MNYSLRQLLLVSLLTASMFIWGVTAFFNYKMTRAEVANLFDAELVQSAKVLNTFVDELLQGGALDEHHWKQERADDSLPKPTKKKIDLQLSTEEKGLSLNQNNELKLLKNSVDEIQGLEKIDDNSPLSKALTEYWQAVPESQSLPHNYEKKIAFQLWSNEKSSRLLLSSKNAPKVKFSSSETNGLSQNKIGDDLWHVFSISDKSSNAAKYIIYVGQKEEVRSQLSDQITAQLVTQFLIGLPILGLVIWLIVGQVLKPITRLERQLAKREASYLKPISTRMQPNEILPVINEINTLFAQLEHAFEHERRFSADASHELRTPLAGVLTQAQVALKTTDEEVRKQALIRIKQAVHRMTYMVQQLLTFSRIESNTEYLTKETTVLSREIVQVIADMEPIAHKKKIQMEFTDDGEVPIIANAPLINILIRNIIDNAIKYTPAQGTILISLTGKEKRLEFCVEDSGPGISPDQYEKSLMRFHRIQETAETAQGSGLGFSIVQRIAAIHGTELILGVSQFGGLKVTVLFTLPKRKTDKSWQKKLSFFNSKKSVKGP